ncbi:uncharacterized protein [Fopius arisanus]|uniref:Exonuclease domain-containing protein n=1 Tax=Fopius arisanus TaxID=64838 RepID=A0A9R1TM58_9HYME|nr:PREDICTED: uncharacterized protein LOC105272796 [Fopius arisanus]
MPVPIKVGLDAAWPKRGSGFKYDSLSGVATSVGVATGKIVARGTRNKACRFCKLGYAPEDHNCQRNWDGSAKAMEASIAEEILTKNKQFEEENVILGTLIGDDDSSTIAAIRRECKHPVAKWSDLNHATKQLNNALWKNKVNRQVIDHLKFAFGCALKKNKDDVSGTGRSITNIVPHAFDEHENCGDWCKWKDDPNNYVHKYLPGGKALVGDSLRKTLDDILDKFWKNADKLAPCGSTQINENLNAIICSKAPKSHHYGDSEGYNFRVDAAILQKNEGTSYITDGNLKCQVSPGKITNKFRAIKDIKREKQANRMKAPAYKRRRKELKQGRTKNNKNLTRKEGVTYSTACAMDRVGNFIDESIARKTIPDDLEFVYFDLETTGLNNKTDEICQIAAKVNDTEIQAFIMPKNGIPPNVTKITNLSINEGCMYYNENPVETISLCAALLAVIEFLRRLGKPIILVAHNGFRFDVPLLIRDIRAVDLWDEFNEVVHGFVDTYQVLQKMLPQRKKDQLKFNQGDLARDFLGAESDEGAHNALNDVTVLQKIINKIPILKEDFRSHAKTVSSVLFEMRMSARKKSLECLQNNVTKSMMLKIAKAGLSLSTLKKCGKYALAVSLSKPNDLGNADNGM